MTYERPEYREIEETTAALRAAEEALFEARQQRDLALTRGRKAGCSIPKMIEIAGISRKNFYVATDKYK